MIVRRSRALLRLPLCLAALLVACGPMSDNGVDGESPAAAAAVSPTRSIDPPALPDSLAPRLVVDDDRVLLSWLEPADDLATGSGHRLRFAVLEGDTWGTVRTVAEGSDFFANWADVPSVVPLGEDAFVAHWLARIGGDTYAYSIRLATSTDGGDSWRDAGFLPLDDSPTEHGFAALIPDGDDVQAFWLDGGRMVDGGPMELRTARLSGASRERGDETVLDARVCECCPLDAAWTASGPVVAYRDRTADEVRNIQLVRQVGDTWSAPVTVHDDGWRIPGCPVNGPVVAVDGARVAVVWFTAPDETPRVRLAFSDDGGASFAPPIEVDTAAPLGRVDLVLDDGEAIVSWLASVGERASLRVQRFDPDGARGEAIDVALTSSSRHAGFPRIVAVGGQLYSAWVDVPDEGPQRLRVMRQPVPR